jgi:glutamate synthase (NADPH/NADH) small chain
VVPVPDPWGFLEHAHEHPRRRPVDVRITDWREVYEPFDSHAVQRQAARCMDCGIPFCHSDTGCPLGNLIPEWNDLVRTGQWRDAIERLHATNNFPEFTGRLCPAPCESACVLGIVAEPVAIKQVEVAIIDRAWEEGWVAAQPAVRQNGRSVGVVGSGPAGLAAAQQLVRAGYDVTVYERADRVGGLLRYGIPEFKMEKRHLDRRVDQLHKEGVRFVTGVDVGRDLPASGLRDEHDALVLAVGSTVGRDVDLPGRHLHGVHLAMDHLVPANRVVAGLQDSTPIDARGRHVVIIGGGDTAADCLGTAHRQGAASVTQLDIYPRPPDVRNEEISPWPTWPWLLRTYPAHEEGGERVFAVAVQRFVGERCIEAVELREVTVAREAGGRRITPVGEPWTIPCDLALLAIGFDGAEPGPLLDDLGVTRDSAGRIRCGPDWRAADSVFACGDAVRGASLVVWAIAEGRSAAAGVDAYLTGASSLPTPVRPGLRPLTA